MKTTYNSLDDAFEAIVDFLAEHDTDEEDNNDHVPDLFFTARPSNAKVSLRDLEDATRVA